MFVRVKTTPNSPRKSIQIVENNRNLKSGKVQQKIIRYIGIAMDDSEERKLKSLALEVIAKMKVDIAGNSPQLNLFPGQSESEVLDNLHGRDKNKVGRKPKKRLDDVLPVNQVTLDMVEEESRLIDGIHEVGGEIYDMLKYNGVLLNNRYNKILKDLVLCRISDPASKLSTSKKLSRYYMKEHDLDAIYRTMDQVYNKIDNIQKTTFEATKSLMSGAVEIVLFDVTTLHLESTEVDDVRAFGYSKNFRFNTTQVVLALATNTDGLPIGYELFEGNKAEVTTLIETIDDWKTKFNIGNVCFIGDRAMFSAKNLEELELRNYNYIVAAKLRSLPLVMQKKILTESNYGIVTEDANSDSKIEITEKGLMVGGFTYDNDDLQTLTDSPVKKATKAQIEKYRELIKQNKSRQFVVSYSPKRAHYDSLHRQNLLEKITKQLDKTTNSAKLISNSALKKFTSSNGRSDHCVDQSKIDADSKWDGFHGVITNMTLKDKNITYEDILKQYGRLVKIEDCFRVNKTTLKMRPIYHFKPERVRAHVAICYMAFSIIRQLEYRVKLIKKISIGSIIEELNSVQSSIYVHKVTKDRYRVPGNFSNEARKIYQAIGITRTTDAHPLL